MKNSVANAQRNVECGLLFIYKRKGNPHSSFFVLRSSFFVLHFSFFILHSSFKIGSSFTNHPLFFINS